MIMATFNLKIFIEDYSIAKETGDLDEEQELLNKFSRFFTSANYKVKSATQVYLFNNPIAKQYPDLQDFATMCLPNF